MKLRAVASLTIVALLSALTLTSSNAVASSAPIIKTHNPSFDIPVYSDQASSVPVRFENGSAREISASADSKRIVYLGNDLHKVNVRTFKDQDVEDKSFVAAAYCPTLSNNFQGQVKNLQISSDGERITFLSNSFGIICSEISGSTSSLPWKAWSATETSSGWMVEALSSPSNSPSNKEASKLSLSAGGDRAAFISNSSELFPGDSNRNNDVFVKNFKDGTTTLVSLGIGGWQSSGTISDAYISPDGKFVAWQGAYTDDDTPIHPVKDSFSSTLMVADLDPDRDGTINKVNVTQVPHPAGVFSAATLKGLVETSSGPAVLLSVGSGQQTSLYTYSLSGELLGLGAREVTKVSNSGDSFITKDATYFFESDGKLNGSSLAHPMVIGSKPTLINSSRDRSYYGTTSSTYEVSTSELMPVSIAPAAVLNKEVIWQSADPANIIPNEFERGKLNEQLIWLTALSGQLGQTIHHRKYDRRDPGVKKPTSTLNESSVTPERRSTIDDIEDLQTLKEETDAVLAQAQERVGLINSAILALACRNPGQWCGAAETAATVEGSGLIVDALVALLAASLPGVQQFDLAFNSVNGSCPGPLEQISNYAATGAGSAYVSYIRWKGEAASWPVTQNILEEYYGIDRPGCWDQVGLDADALLEGANGFASGLGGKWKGLGASITAVEMSINSF